MLQTWTTANIFSDSFLLSPDCSLTDDTFTHKCPFSIQCQTLLSRTAAFFIYLFFLSFGIVNHLENLTGHGMPQCQSGCVAIPEQDLLIRQQHRIYSDAENLHLKCISGLLSRCMLHLKVTHTQSEHAVQTQGPLPANKAAHNSA